jgi:hypothetical protein
MQKHSLKFNNQLQIPVRSHQDERRVFSRNASLGEAQRTGAARLFTA